MHDHDGDDAGRGGRGGGGSCTTPSQPPPHPLPTPPHPARACRRCCVAAAVLQPERPLRPPPSCGPALHGGSTVWPTSTHMPSSWVPHPPNARLWSSSYDKAPRRARARAHARAQQPPRGPPPSQSKHCMAARLAARGHAKARAQQQQPMLPSWASSSGPPVDGEVCPRARRRTHIVTHMLYRLYGWRQTLEHRSHSPDARDGGTGQGGQACPGPEAQGPGSRGRHGCDDGWVGGSRCACPLM